MTPSVLALIILALLLVVYITNVIPPVVATLVALMAMTLTNIITPSQAFAGFGGTAAIMIMGMNVVGAAFFTTGVSAALGRFLYTKGGSNERVFILICPSSTAWNPSLTARFSESSYTCPVLSHPFTVAL